MGSGLVSNEGLFLIDAATETLIKHYSEEDGLPTNALKHLYKDASGIYWMTSSGGGLIRWDRERNDFRQFTTEHGLSNNYLYAVYEDDFENLWLPSDYGLMAFDKTSFTTKLYLPSDGIAHEEFNTHSHLQAEDGTLFFGGLKGITRFHPADLHEIEPKQRPLSLISVRVLVSEADQFENRTQGFKQTGRLQFKPDEKVIELDFALLDYQNIGSNQFAYRVKGYQEHWIYTKNSTISLFGLPYGQYTLEVKGQGASGQWNSTILQIPLEILRPFYLQSWFVVSVLLLITILVWASIRLRILALKRNQERLEMEVERRTLTIAEQAEALKALDRAKTRFFSNITHEFRTPLTLIIGPLEQVTGDQAMTGFLKKRLHVILKNARHLLSLINQMLDIAKVEGGSMEVELSRGDIVAYTKDLVKLFEPLADKKKQSLSFICSTKQWNTYFDKDKWNKIIYNLLSNAIKFTRAEGLIQLNLLQINKAGQRYIRLDVKDTGIGIEKEHLPQVFNRFYQVDGSFTRVQGGTGIGLALVKELVELQGGEIWVNSEVGKGTTFEVHLPLKEAVPSLSTPLKASSEVAMPEPLADEGSFLPPVAEAAITGDKLDLLLIEDNVEMRAYIRSCIDTSRYNILEASDGEDGIQKALALVPDLIVSDVMMPKKNGFEVTETIRGAINTSHIPLILLTAKASLKNRLDGWKRGADAYLTKPFSPEELTLRIDKLIEVRQILQKRYASGEVPEASSGLSAGRSIYHGSSQLCNGAYR